LEDVRHNCRVFYLWRWDGCSQKGNFIIPENWFGKGFDLASIVMLVGGLFLIYKSVKEINEKLEGEDHLADPS
jgi:uncharacterized membrane protein